MYRTRLILAALLCSVVAITALFGGSSPAGASAPKATTPKPPSLTSEVRTLRQRVSAIPAKTRGQKKARARLLITVSTIDRRVKSNQLCKAKSSLLVLRTAVRGSALSGIKAKKRSGVTASALRLQGLILARPAAKGCGGAKTAPSTTGAPVSTVLKNTPTELEVRVSLPPAELAPAQGRGKPYEELKMPGLATDSAPGAPGVPTLGQSFAIPEGATVKVDTANSDSYTLEGVDLYPAQAQAADATKGEFADKPFEVNSKAYASSQPYPVTPTTAGQLGELRDLKVGQLAIAGAQYTPKSKKLKVFTSVDVKVSFPGSTGQFGGEGAGSPWNEPFKRVYSSLFVNGQVVADHLHDLGNLLQPCGEEMLIVTSPALRSAADTLATARNAKGILTKVVETGSGAGQAGTTADEIRTYVQAQVAKTNCIRPSYLILFGNTANVPTFTGDPGIPGIPSDFDYALKFREVYLPNLAPGRISAENLDQANTIVNKIIGYEDHPPTDPAFYSNATVTSYFQDDDSDGQENRGFVQTTEKIRAALLNHGKTVSRVYTTDAGISPKKFNDGTDLPASLKKPTFAWNGTGTDVVNQVNTGRFLLLHRDHGAPTWVDHPVMDSGTVSSLTNGTLLPVFFSVNCASGTYDNPAQPSFDELWLRKAGGGAVGVVGDSRNSPTEVNNRMALGMFDAIFPDTLPYSGSSTSVKTMGDVVNLGKLHTILDSVSIRDYYQTQWNASAESATADIRAENRLYGYFGDPSMSIRTTAPLGRFASAATLVSAAKVHAVFGSDAAGGIATLLEDGLPIGKAFVAGDGSVDIDPTSTPGNGKLAVILNQDGVDSAPVTVREAVSPTPTPTPTAAPKPNLVVDSVSYEVDPSVVVAVVHRWVVKVRNAGAAPTSGPVDVKLHQFGGRIDVDTTNHTAAALPAGGTETLYFSPQSSNPSATATIDPSNAIDESNESDNTATGTVPNG